MNPPAANRDAAPPDARRRTWIVNALMAVSLANLCFVRAWFSVLYDADYGYFNKVPVNTVTLIGLMVNLLLLALVFWLAATSLQRLTPNWPKRLGLLAVLALLLIPFNFVRLTYLDISGSTMLALLHHPATPIAGLLAVILLWRGHAWVARAVRAGLLILFPLAALVWIKLLLVLLHVVPVRQYEGPPVLAPPLPHAKTQPRVVWLIFDELDYRVTFPERPSGLALPEFDRLRAESLFATNAFPPANGTVLSMPALTTGQRVLAANPCSPEDLRLTLAGTNHPITWSALPNVFSRARELEFNCAIVAWYHPYRRVFSNALSHCSWYPFPLYEQARGRTLREAMANQLWSCLAPLQQRRLEVRIHQESLADALHAVTNRQFGLTFLHLPGPHKPGIYRPKEGRLTMTHFSTVEGYFDNLALTDLALGQLRRQMEAAQVWDQSWLVVTSDHCWREAARHDGKSDLRVPFLVKAPGANQGMEVTDRFNTLVTQSLILAILREEVRSSEEARDWLARNRLDLPTVQGDSKHDQ